MARKISKDLEKFLEVFPEDFRKTALFLRDFILKEYPDSFELIYDNYNALAVGFSLSEKLGDTFVSFAVYTGGLHLGFYRGVDIESADTKKILLGEGKQYRFIRVPDIKTFPKADAKKLIKAAYLNAISRVKDKSKLVKGGTITKMSLAKKRRPGNF